MNKAGDDTQLIWVREYPSTLLANQAAAGSSTSEDKDGQRAKRFLKPNEIPGEEHARQLREKFRAGHRWSIQRKESRRALVILLRASMDQRRKLRESLRGSRTPAVILRRVCGARIHA